MFVTNWISTTKIQKISEITNFFRHYFLSRTEVKHRYFADFMPKVVIGGNKVTIKTPLIATRYLLIIKELSISVTNVALN